MKIENLIFDLDDTLYSPTGKMSQGISTRMIKCVAEYFNITDEQAREIRDKNINNFSTTLEWLRSEGFTDIEGFFAKVHPENECEELQKDERLRPFLQSIPLPKVILTNAPKEHAERVLKILDIKDLFIDICDIRTVNLFGKPYPESYQTALKMINAKIENTLFIDDQKKYTDGFVRLGGKTALIGSKNQTDSNTICLNTIYELKNILNN